MLLFNKICSTAQVLRLFHILLNTGRKLNVDKSYKRSFEVPCPGGLLYESKKNIFWGCNYNTTISHQENCQQAES